MSRTIICHFYNEEYLLPWWLNHHKRIFQHGIMIDYASTDRSRDIIKEHCPTWEIVPSRNEFFTYHEIDREVMDIERSITGWRVCLNVTEFMLGDLRILTDQPESCHRMPSLMMVDKNWGAEPSPKLALVGQCTSGLHYKDHFSRRWGRSIHNLSVHYPQGRHYFDYTTTDLAIIWMGWSPWTTSGLNRKLQIKQKLGEWDLHAPVGLQHKLDRQGMFHEYENNWKPHIIDLSSEIDRLKNLLDVSLTSMVDLEY